MFTLSKPEIKKQLSYHILTLVLLVADLAKTK